MKISTFLRVLRVAAGDPKVFVARRQYIFVLSHMRSRSSLLCHILGSHPEISGYAETHRSYHSWTDLLALHLTVYDQNDDQLAGRFVLDKLLHNNLRLGSKILASKSVRFVFLVRDPANTLASIVDMRERIHGQAPEVLKVVHYYIERMARLSAYAEAVTGRCAFIDSRDLVDHSADVLRFLTRWLGLSSPLSAEYSLFSHTGTGTTGDPSDAIRLGKITPSLPAKPAVQLSTDLRASMETAYEQCRNILLEHCARRQQVSRS